MNLGDVVGVPYQRIDEPVGVATLTARIAAG